MHSHSWRIIFSFQRALAAILQNGYSSARMWRALLRNPVHRASFAVESISYSYSSLLYHVQTSIMKTQVFSLKTPGLRNTAPCSLYRQWVIGAQPRSYWVRAGTRTCQLFLLFCLFALLISFIRYFVFLFVLFRVFILCITFLSCMLFIKHFYYFSCRYFYRVCFLSSTSIIFRVDIFLSCMLFIKHFYYFSCRYF